jgi:hypothetical protein
MENEHDNLEEAFKKRLAEKGIPYFGAVEKHYLHDARGRKYPHAPNQPPHGRRPGKRTLMTGLRALANRKPDLDIPKWNEMLEMGHGEVLRLFEHHFGDVKPEGGVVRRVEVDPNDHEGFNRDEERANSDAKTLPGAGKQGENLRVDQFPVTRMMDGKKPAKPRQRLVPRHRRPGKDVVDYHDAGHANEGTRARRAGAGAPAARGPFNRNPESMVGEGRRPATEVPNNEPARRVRRNRLNVRPAAPAKARGFEENKQRGEAAARGVGNNVARNHIMDMLRGAKGQENLDDLAANLRAAARQIEAGDHPDIDSKFARVYHGIADELQGKARAGQTPVTPPRLKPKPAHAGTDRPDEEATRVARERGVPKTDAMREMPANEQVPVREFKQKRRENSWVAHSRLRKRPSGKRT